LIKLKYKLQQTVALFWTWIESRLNINQIFKSNN